MKKVCFVADRFFWEEEMGDLLYQEINKISNEDPTKGATKVFHYLQPLYLISIHAPTKGATANITKNHFNF